MDYDLELKQKMKEIEDRIFKKHGIKKICPNEKRIYNEKRRLKRRKSVKIRFCTVCKVEFETSHAIKCTCSDKCSNIHRINLARQNYHNKKVTLSNNK